MLDFNAKELNIAVIMGGNSAEREVSLRSGKAIVAALTNNGVIATPIDGVQELLKLNLNEYDAVFNILHGEAGENGELAGLLSCLKVRYTGCDMASAVASWNKNWAKILVSSNGIKTPYSQLITHNNKLKIKGNGPWIVKPNQEGSSVGLYYCQNQQDLITNTKLALKIVDSVLIEEFIKGSECTVSIIKGEALPVIRIEPKVGLYDYNAKYQSGNTNYFCPSGYPKELENTLKKDALTVYDILGLTGWARVDFMIDEQGKHWFLEINTTPGMTKTSLVPKAAKAFGWSFDELVLQILSTAFMNDQGEHI